jgi:hypothetical protein
MSLTLEPIRVATGSDEEGMLVFTDGQRLVAVLTRLSDQHEDMAGHWYLEAAFGWLDGPDHPTFPNLDAAQLWLAQRMAQSGDLFPPAWVESFVDGQSRDR